MISLDQFYEVKDDYSSCQNMSDVRELDGLISAHQMTAMESYKVDGGDGLRV